VTKYGRNIFPIKTHPRLSHSGPSHFVRVARAALTNQRPPAWLSLREPTPGGQVSARGALLWQLWRPARSAPGAPYSGSYGRLETGHQLTPAEAETGTTAEAETGTPAVRGTESSAAPVCAASPAAAQRQLAQVYIFQITDHSHRRYQTYANLSTARLFQGYVVLKTYHGKVGLA